MLKLADRVKQTSVTTGTGDIIFNATIPSFQSFAEAIGDGNSTYYAIETYTKFEIGIGTYHSSNNSLSRDTVIISSDGTSKIDLEGVSTIFVTYPSSKHVILDDFGFSRSFEPTYAGIKFPDGTTQTTAGGGDGSGGSNNRAFTSINSTTTLFTNANVVFITSLASDIEVTLPLASSMEGKTISFKFKSNQNKCTILPQISDEIDNGSSHVIQYKNESISCFSDGDDWYIL